MYEDHVTNY